MNIRNYGILAKIIEVDFMAKVNSLINLEGTFQNVTHVKSRAYGKHVRAVRGTYKSAEINESFKKSKDEMALSNLPAKIIKDALESFRANFKGGMLWQMMVSHFIKEYRRKNKFDFTSLLGWEIHKEYPLSRLLKFNSVVAEPVDSNKVSLALDYHRHPDFKRDYINGYMISVLAIYPMLEKKMAITECQSTEVISLEGDCRVCEFTFHIPEEATQVLFCAKVEGCLGMAVDTSHSTKGMKIVSSLASLA